MIHHNGDTSNGSNNHRSSMHRRDILVSNRMTTVLMNLTQPQTDNHQNNHNTTPIHFLTYHRCQAHLVFFGLHYACNCWISRNTMQHSLDCYHHYIHIHATSHRHVPRTPTASQSEGRSDNPHLSCTLTERLIVCNNQLPHTS